ncbi:MAG: Polyprenyl synthetase [Bacillales bacterium]|jgi:competence protein ComQ|nr:Polyprenyl synthetase [Bacillales bacterium]
MKTVNNDKISKEMMKIINNENYDEHMESKINQYINFKTYSGLTFGKLAVFHYRMYGGSKEEIYKIAGIVELLILTFDIIDDLQDQDNFSTPWSKDDNAITLNIAIALFSLCNKSISMLEDYGYGDKRIVDLYQRLCMESINGQYLDVRNVIHTEEDYINMVCKKSGSLTSLACMLGASFADVNQAELKIISDYSIILGLIAQINNDIIDIQRMDDKNDILYRKRTLPFIYILGGANKSSKEVLKFLELDTTEIKANLPNIVEEIKKSGAIEYAKVISYINKTKAISIINKLNINSDSMNNLLQFMN